MSRKMSRSRRRHLIQCVLKMRWGGGFFDGRPRPYQQRAMARLKAPGMRVVSWPARHGAWPTLLRFT